MQKPMLRLVRKDDVLPLTADNAEDDARLGAEYRQALLLLEVSDYERNHGRNAYTAYVQKHGKRPPPKEARAMALVMGKRVKAEDGRWYPKKTAAEREFDRQRRRRQDEFAEASRASHAIFTAINAISVLRTDPEDVEILSWHAREIEAGMNAAIEWLNRFAAARSARDENSCSQKSSSSGYRAARPST